MKRWFDLQLFAADSVINTTSGYADNATGNVEAFNAPDDLSPAMKTYYDTELLENARAELYHDQFGKRQPLPKGRGKTMEWRKWKTLGKALTPLVEGVTPTGDRLGETSINSAITQHGKYVAVSDQLELHAIDNVILGATEELGSSAGATKDTLARNELVKGTQVIYADILNNGAVASTPNSRYELTKNAVLTPDIVNKAVTQLKKMKAPKMNGDYVAIIHPSVAYDLRKSNEWVEAHKYASPEEIYNGEIGKLHGCRFVETTEAKIFRGAGLTEAAATLTVNASGGITASTGSGTTTLLVDEEIADTDRVAKASASAPVPVLIGGKLFQCTAVTSGSAGNASLSIAQPHAAITDNAVVYPGEGGAEGVAVYATLFLGKDAYGSIDPEGAGMEMIIKQKGSGGTSDPLNQRSTVGYKFSTATKILYEERLLRVESGSAYSETDEEN